MISVPLHFCGVCIRHGLQDLATEPFCWRVLPCLHQSRGGQFIVLVGHFEKAIRLAEGHAF